MATAGSIVVDLLMRTGSFETDSKAAEKRMKQFSKEAKEAGTAIGLAFAGAATLMTASVKSSIDRMDELSKTAKVLGVNAEEFSKLAYAADFADLSVEDLQGAFGKLTKAQVEALDAGSKQAKIFDALGISIQDANGNLRPTTDLLYDFADAFQRQKGSQEVVTAGMAIFGKNFQGMIDLLKDGSQGLRDSGAEAKAFGQVLSAEAGAQAEEFNDSLAKMKLWVQGVSNAVAADLLPDMLNLSGAFLDGATNGDKLEETAAGIADSLRVLASAAGFVGAAFDLTGNAIATLMGQAHALGKFLSGDFAGGKAMYSAASQGFDQKINSYFGAEPAGPAGPVKVNFIDPADLLAEDKKAVEEMRRARAEAERLRKLAFGDSPSAKGSGSKGKSDAEKSAERLGEAFRFANDQLERNIALYGDSSELSKINYEIQFGALKGLDAAAQATLRTNASLKDMLGNIDVADEIAGENAEKFAAAVASMFGIDEGADTEVKGFFDRMTVFGDQAARNMQDSFADYLFDPFEDGLGGMVKGFADSLRRMAAEAASAKLFEMLGTAASQYAGKGSSWINAIGGMLGGARAGGGPVAGDSIYRVGEGGRPELFQQGGKSYLIPGDTGTVRPITAGLPSSGPAVGDGGGNIQVIVNTSNGDRVRARQERQTGSDGQMLRKIILDVVSDDMASGGVVAQAGQSRFDWPTRV